jgi:hypothetical protein
MKSPIVRSSDNLLTVLDCTADSGYPRSIVKRARERPPRPQRAQSRDA